jgi:poly(A) polymerase
LTELIEDHVARLGAHASGETMTLGIEPVHQLNSPIRPLLAGDLIAGRRVAGFAWSGPAGDAPSTHLDDRLLLDGDEQLVAPPDRPVPQTADGAEPVAVMPPGDLSAHCVHQAESLDVTVPMRADALLDLPGAPWRPLIRPLLGAVRAGGHQLWLSGGAARDLVAGAPLREVNDLDLAGTVPPGRYTDITCQMLRALGMSEFRTTISPSTLVCSVIQPRSGIRIIEYRGLSQGGFRFPVVGSRLAEDAQYRDFAFNALLYDVLEHQVIDASGTGLDDLLGERRRFTPQNVSKDPYVQAEIVLRAAKFVLRWCDGPALDLASLDLEPLRRWIATLPPTLCRTLTHTQWNGLRSKYGGTVRASRQHQQEFAATLPEPGRELIEALIRGAR